MKNSLKPVTIPLVLIGLSLSSFAEPAAGEKLNAKCPISGKPVVKDCTTTYEKASYAFCSSGCRDEWVKAREESLYHKVGGKAAIGAAVDLFYTKVLADDRVKGFFRGVNMKKQIKKQKAFFSAALGGPEPWKGDDMREAHAHLELTDVHFNAIAQHLQASLEELKVKKEYIDQILAVVGSTKDDVLNKEVPAPTKEKTSN